MKITVVIEGQKTATFMIDTPGKLTDDMLDALNVSIKEYCGIKIVKTQPLVIEKHEHHHHDTYPRPYPWWQPTWIRCESGQTETPGEPDYTWTCATGIDPTTKADFTIYRAEA